MESPVVRHLQIEADIVAEDDGRFVGRLADAYALRRRPLCLCRPMGVPMYVARIGRGFIVKRMPRTGKDHHPHCPSFESADTLFRPGTALRLPVGSKTSGRPTAIDVKVRFSRGPIATSAGAIAHRHDCRTNSGMRLSLLALLHLLWQASGLVEWTGHWIGKRRWWHVHRYLVEATRRVSIEGEMLSERVLIPEPFKVEDKTAIKARRSGTIARLLRDGSKQRMLLIGEVKAFRGVAEGHEIVVRHMPDVRLPLGNDQLRRLQRRFSPALGLWHSERGLHLIAIATVEAAAAGALRVVEIAVMTVTEHWLPVADLHELQLVTKLARYRGKMVKVLSFDGSGTQPMATVTLPDARPLPWALYLVPADANTDFDSAIAQSILSHPDRRAWIWRPADGDMPPLPYDGVRRASVDGEDD
ncbi:DUF1173 family protein [Pseudorhizobium pelagicum]|uniref:DUF1173 family protein n=1 Tax=Pseudorhizobium pelagicum TaxID=1509405 RepID=UPI0009DEED1E